MTIVGSFTVTVPKETPGELFEGLDMITKLLTNKGQTTGQSPLIEVLSKLLLQIFLGIIL